MTGGREIKHQGYDPGHPWYYKLGGRILPPDEITPSIFGRDVPAGIEIFFTRKDLRHLDDPDFVRKKIEEAEKTLKEYINRYLEVIDGGEDALSAGDKLFGFGIETALSLTLSHVSYQKAQVKALKKLYAKYDIQLSLF